MRAPLAEGQECRCGSRSSGRGLRRPVGWGDAEYGGEVGDGLLVPMGQPVCYAALGACLFGFLARPTSSATPPTIASTSLVRRAKTRMKLSVSSPRATAGHQASCAADSSCFALPRPRPRSGRP